MFVVYTSCSVSPCKEVILNVSYVVLSRTLKIIRSTSVSRLGYPSLDFFYHSLFPFPPISNLSLLHSLFNVLQLFIYPLYSSFSLLLNFFPSLAILQWIGLDWLWALLLLLRWDVLLCPVLLSKIFAQYLFVYLFVCLFILTFYLLISYLLILSFFWGWVSFK